MTRFLRRFLSLFTRRRDEAELAREMASHLALLEDEHRRRGLSTGVARLAARPAMGSDGGTGAELLGGFRRQLATRRAGAAFT